MKRNLVLASLLTAAMAGSLGISGGVANATPTPRSGELHVTKDCSAYQGLAGQSCTITTSSLGALAPGTRIVYISPADFGSMTLDTDITISTGPGNTAFGHCSLDLVGASGECAITGGTGKFTRLRATVDVSFDSNTGLWNWDGTFAFNPRA